MTVEKEVLLKFFIVGRRVFKQVNNIGVIEFFGKIVKERRMRLLFFFSGVVFAAVRHSHKEELCTGLNLF